MMWRLLQIFIHFFDWKEFAGNYRKKHENMFYFYDVSVDISVHFSSNIKLKLHINTTVGECPGHDAVQVYVSELINIVLKTYFCF